MRIKICGLFRDEDIDFVNEARPDYAGFVFAKSKRQVTPVLAQYLRFRLADSIIPVGVFVNAPLADIAALYENGIISIAQLHGEEDESYIQTLKKAGGGKPIPVIKVIKSQLIKNLTTNQCKLTPSVQARTKKKLQSNTSCSSSSSRLTSFETSGADYLLLDSGAGSGKTFDWSPLNSVKFSKPWFLAGGIDINNIDKAISLNPFAIDVSSGAETDGIKDRKKILQLVSSVK